MLAHVGFYQKRSREKMTLKVVAELIHMAMVPKSHVPQETQGAVKKCLTAQGKEQYLSDAKPATDSKDYRKWVKEDTMVDVGEDSLLHVVEAKVGAKLVIFIAHTVAAIIILQKNAWRNLESRNG
ncbi:hypothetical protein Q3G72_000601 [Acer saccharum]|nr:hypothetical protein Q3G72_000601 [Acer saccharum]